MAAAVAFLAIALIGPAQVCAQEVYYSPEERLHAIDIELISTVKQSSTSRATR